MGNSGSGDRSVKVSRWIANLNQEDVDVCDKAVNKLLAKPSGYIREAGGIEPLVAFLKAEANTTREFAMSVLEGLICRDYGVSTPDQDAVREAGGIELLVALLASKSKDMCGKAVHMLESLARENPVNKDAIREAGGIVPLVALLKNADPDVRLYAVGALSALASANSTNKDAICDAGGVVALVPLLKDGSALARQYAAAALASLAHNILNVPAIRATEAIPLLKVLLEDKVAKVRANATMALKLLGHRISAMKPELGHNADSKPLVISLEEAIPLEEVVRIIRFKELSYTDTDYLGRGAFSKVYKGVWKGIDVAVKEFLFQGLSEEATKELRKEALIMQRLRHSNIMPLYGACVEPGHRSLVMPYLGGGSLRQMLSDYSQKLSWQLRWTIALGVARGVSYLHGYTPPILHRDLKSPNVMLDERCVPMVADFGLSKAKIETSSEKGEIFPPRGSLPWMATELFDGKRHSEASDIFALGVVFWELATRKIPWSGVNVYAIVMRLTAGERNEIPKNTPSVYATLIKRCWAQRIEERPQVDDLVDELEAHQGESVQVLGSMTNRMDSSSSRTQSYVRHPVAADGDCGYTAFGIARDEALSQLLGDLESVKVLLQPAIREALLTDRFYQYLIANKVIGSDVTHQAVIEDLEAYFSITAVYRFYLRYDIQEKQIDAGYAHPGVLQALAHIRGIALRIWRLGEDDVLTPNRGELFDYFEYIPPDVEEPRPVDILFIGNNHFELLESDESNHRVSEGDMPNYTRTIIFEPKCFE